MHSRRRNNLIVTLMQSTNRTQSSQCHHFYEIYNKYLVVIVRNCSFVSPFKCYSFCFMKYANQHRHKHWSWWRHQMEIFSALLAICVGNSPLPGEFPTHRPVTRSFDVFFDLHPNKQLSKQCWGWWFETPSWWLWRHRNDMHLPHACINGVLLTT